MITLLLFFKKIPATFLYELSLSKTFKLITLSQEMSSFQLKQKKTQTKEIYWVWKYKNQLSALVIYFIDKSRGGGGGG